MISFTNPLMLLLLVLAIPVVYFYQWTLKKRKSAAIKFSNIAFVKSAINPKKMFKQKLLFYLLLVVLVVLILALADPLVPLKMTKKGVNVVMVLDVSGSMQATDYKPTRIEAAKLSAQTLIKNLKVNDNVGIVIFADGATTASFLTNLKERALNKLSTINAQQGRTAIGDGLALGVDMATSIPNKKKLIILLSDGVSNAGIISPDDAIEFSKQSEIQVYTIGMGSVDKVVLGYDFFGNPQYAELDESTLRKIAESTGGEYYRAVDETTLDQIYQGLSKKIKREKEDVSIQPFLIGLAAVLLLVELYLRHAHFRIVS